MAPSGRTVVFVDNYGGSRVLYRRDLDRIDPEPIVGTEGGSDVFFSQDGRSLGFEKRSELWTVSLDGGTPQMLLPNQPLRGGTWGEGDRIVFGRVGSGLWMASTTGGEPRQLTAAKQGERHELPQMLPGGRAVLFTILSIDKPPRAAVHLLGSGETRSLLKAWALASSVPATSCLAGSRDSGRSASIRTPSRHLERLAPCVTMSSGQQAAILSSPWTPTCWPTCAQVRLPATRGTAS